MVVIHRYSLIFYDGSSTSFVFEHIDAFCVRTGMFLCQKQKVFYKS